GAALVVSHDDGAVLGIDNSAFADGARLVAMLLVLSSVLIFARTGLWQHLKAALVWFVLGFGLVMGYTFRADLEDAGARLIGVLMPGRPVTVGEAVVINRGASNQFVIDARVNGALVRMLFDTGA